MKAQLGMTNAPYYYGESEPSDDKDNLYVDIVEENELVGPLS